MAKHSFRLLRGLFWQWILLSQHNSLKKETICAVVFSLIYYDLFDIFRYDNAQLVFLSSTHTLDIDWQRKLAKLKKLFLSPPPTALGQTSTLPAHHGRVWGKYYCQGCGVSSISRLRWLPNSNYTKFHDFVFMFVNVSWQISKVTNMKSKEKTQ